LLGNPETANFVELVPPFRGTDELFLTSLHIMSSCPPSSVNLSCSPRSRLRPTATHYRSRRPVRTERGFSDVSGV